MAAICRHCSTPYRVDSGVDGFCCAGCREVYSLICEEGLGNYYRKQDRIAEPLKDRALLPVDHAAFKQTQSQIETMANPSAFDPEQSSHLDPNERPAADGPAQAAFTVSGMSCMGCVWLIERLAERQPGSVSAQVSLTRQTLEIIWLPGQFNLVSLAEELLRFGYRLDAKPLAADDRPRFSPLALRTLLSLVFTGNALLLAAYSEVAPTVALAELLSLACLCFTVLLGAAPFFQSVYRAAQIRRWHSDLVPTLLILAALIYLSYQLIFGQFSLNWSVFAACLLISVLVSARFFAANFFSMSRVRGRIANREKCASNLRASAPAAGTTPRSPTKPSATCVL